MKNKLVFGWGVNDVDRRISAYETVGEYSICVWRCPYYADWINMIKRCYDCKTQKTQPTYIGCTVCEEWKHFSNFIKWVDSQPNRDWMNCSLDKDLLLLDNKHYSPDTAVYVDKKLNSFITDCRKSRGDLLLGVHIDSGNGGSKFYRALCGDPFKRRGRHIGRYSTELEAHKAWQAKKHEYACQLADLQDDSRVAKVLRERYAPDKDWTKA